MHNVTLPQPQMPCVLAAAQAERAYFIADVAHTAKGQTRDDRVTPYIRHPQRCAELTFEFMLEGGYAREPFNIDDVTTAVAAAYLHDVVEDTRVSYNDLRRYGIDATVIEIVDLLTKKNAPHEPEDAGYFAAIAANPIARYVKAADRCANLDDVAQAQSGAARWMNYVERTYSDVLPMYENDAYLRAQLIDRMERARESLRAVLVEDHLAKAARLENALASAPPEHHQNIHNELAIVRRQIAQSHRGDDLTGAFVWDLDERDSPETIE